MSSKFLDSVPPREQMLPERWPRESAADWIARCAATAVEAAISKLATDEGWQIDALHGDQHQPRGWRILDPKDTHKRWINIYLGPRHHPSPAVVQPSPAIVPFNKGPKT